MLNFTIKKHCFIKLFFLFLTTQFFQICFSRVENIKRASNGLATHVFDSTISGGQVAISGYPSKFAKYDSQTQLETAIFDNLTQQIYLAEAESNSTGDRSLMVGKIVDQSKIVLSSLTPTGHPLRNKKFKQIGQNSTKIVALTTDATSDLYVLEKSNPWQVTTITVKDGAGANGVVDKFLVLEDRIIVGVFQNSKTEYANNAAGRIKALSFSGSEIGMLCHPTSGNTLIVDTYDNTVLLDSNHGPNDLTAICGKKALRKIGSMRWDEKLKRLFIAFSHIDDIDTDADVMPFLVCRFNDNGKFIAEGLAPLSTVTNQKNGIVSFKIENLFGIYSYTVPFLEILTDNAGRKYLITNINYRENDHPAGRRFFCLPIFGQENIVNDSRIGKLAKKDFSSLATSSTDFYVASLETESADSPALVGGINVPVSKSGQISSMLVASQTVFVSTIGKMAAESGNYRAQESGVWASSAIFDSSGIIKGWTPWIRVAGTAHSVYNVFFDTIDNQFWTVFDLDDNPSLTYQAPFGVAKTELGLGNQTEHEAGLFRLQETLETNFKNVVCTNHFPAVQSKGLRNISLTTFCGTEKILLASTGTSVGKVAGTNDFLEPYRSLPSGFADTVNPYSSASHAKLITLPPGQGAVFCSEIARIPNTENSGWLFLGRSKGLSVFAKSPATGGLGDGQGWASASTGPNDLNIFQSLPATGIAEMPGKLYPRELDGISDPILELHARQETTLASGTRSFLYALTGKNLYKIELMTSKFLASSSARTALSPVSIFSAKDDERLISLHLLPDSNCGYLLTNNNQDIDPSIPLRLQSKDRSIRLYLINSIDTATNRNNFADVSLQLGSIFEISQIKLLTTNLFNATLNFPSDINPPAANLIITTGGLTNPNSKIYAIPVFCTIASDPKAATNLPKKYCQEISSTGNAVLISDIKKVEAKDPRLSLGTNLTSLPYAYGSAHKQDGLLKEDLTVSLHDGKGHNISSPNLRTCNTWTDSATGSTIIAGNFGIRIQE